MAKITNKGLIARKVGMTRIIDDAGAMIPVTLIQVEHQRITKVLNKNVDGYNGYQVGFVEKAEKNLSKADLKRLRKNAVDENFSVFREFRIEENSIPNYKLGDVLNAELLTDVPSVDVTGITKGRGFQGAVKRWNTAIGRMTHGSCYHRRPGSLGMRATPGRVFKNKHIPGHYGDENVTICNLKIVDVDTTNNVIALKGSVPGFNNGYLELRPTSRK